LTYDKQDNYERVMMNNEAFLERGRKAFWPDVSILEGAKLAVTYGWVASYLIACSTTISALVGWTSISSLIDAVFWLIIGYGIFRNSRIASVIGLMFFAFELLSKMQHGKSVGIGVILLLYLVNGVRGTLAYYRLKKVHNKSVLTTEQINMMKDMVDRENGEDKERGNV
jgi:hypothetical protein